MHLDASGSEAEGRRGLEQPRMKEGREGFFMQTDSELSGHYRHKGDFKSTRLDDFALSFGVFVSVCVNTCVFHSGSAAL